MPCPISSAAAIMSSDRVITMRDKRSHTPIISLAFTFPLLTVCTRLPGGVGVVGLVVGDAAEILTIGVHHEHLAVFAERTDESNLPPIRRPIGRPFVDTVEVGQLLHCRA